MLVSSAEKFEIYSPTGSSPTHSGGGQSSDDLKANLDDALAQLDVARQQRTEVSSELFKCRCLIDELKEQKAQLQTEMTRRLATHRDDVERIQSMQKELDRMRGSYSSKETEIIELSTRIQELMAKIESTEQHRELKEENELLWRKLDELKRSTDLPTDGETNSLIADQWRSRFSILEAAISSAFASRVPGASPLDEDEEEEGQHCVSMLQSILQAEETLRHNLGVQVSNLKSDLRKSKDELHSVKDRVAQNEVASLRIKMSEDQLAERDLETRKLRQELEANKVELNKTKADLNHAKADLNRVQNQCSDLRRDNRTLKAEAIDSEQVTTLQNEIHTLRAQVNERVQDAQRVAEDEKRVLEEETHDQLRTLRAQLKDAQRQAQDAQRQAQDARRETQREAEAAAREAQVNETHEELRTLLRQAEAQLEAEREEYKDGQAEWWRAEKQLKDKIKGLEKNKGNSSEIEALKVSLSEAQEQLKHSRPKDDEVVQSLRTEVDQLQKSLARVTEESGDEAREARQEAEQAREEAREAREEAEQARQEAEQARQEAEQEMDSLRLDVEKATARVEKAHEEADAACRTAATALREAETARDEAQRTQEDTIRRMKSDFEQKMNNMEKEFHEALVGPSVSSLIADEETLTPEQQVVRLQGAISRAHAAKREVSDTVEVQQIKIADLEKECESLRAQITKVEEGWKAEYDVYFSNLSRVTTALDKAYSEKKIADEENQAVKAKLANLTAQLTRLTKQKEEKLKEDKLKQEASDTSPTAAPKRHRKDSPPIKATPSNKSSPVDLLTPKSDERISSSPVFALANVQFVGYLVLTGWLTGWLGFLYGQLAH